MGHSQEWKERYDRLMEGEALILNPGKNGLWHWTAPRIHDMRSSSPGRQAKCGSGTWLTPSNSTKEVWAKPFGPDEDIEDITCSTCRKKYEDYCASILSAQIDRYYAE